MFRYILAAVFVAAVALFIVNSYKQKAIEKELDAYMQELNLAYRNAYLNLQKSADLIFFSGLMHDETIKSTYKKIVKQNHLDSLATYEQKLFKSIEQNFYYFKSFLLQDISFYLPNNELLLSAKYQQDKSNKTTSKESLLYVNSTKKELHDIKINKEFASVSFLKPLFDEQLEHLGAVELEFSFESIILSMQNQMEFDVFFMFKVANIGKQDFYMPFDLHPLYALEKNLHNTYRYNDEFFKHLSEEKKEHIKQNIFKNQEFSLEIFHHGINQALLFMPLNSEFNKEPVGYIVALQNAKESNIQAVYEVLNYYIMIGFFIVLLVFILLFNLNRLKYRNFKLIKENNELLMAIDKYVVMAQTDTKGIITFVTQSFCEISGYSKQELIGKNINIIRHPSMSKLFFENMWKELKEKKKWEGEIKNIDKNGNSYWVKGIIFPRYDIDNKLIGYSSIRVNITDTKQLRKINNLLKEDLSNKLNEIKMRDESLMDKTKVILMGKILDTVSHQWKKPLSAISIELANFKARINNHQLDVGNLNLIHDEIQSQTKQLSITLNEFKTLFFKQEYQDKYNVYSAVQEAIDLLSQECTLHHIHVELKASKEIFCYGVHNELRQVISNILKTQIEYMIANDTKNPTIKLAIEQKQQHVLITCQDNIQGEFQRIISTILSENYDERVHKDVGINLYIAKLLIEKIGAKIWFEKKTQDNLFFIELVSHDRRKDKRT
jgi:PAS domain S-box-containing protein